MKSLPLQIIAIGLALLAGCASAGSASLVTDPDKFEKTPPRVAARQMFGAVADQIIDSRVIVPFPPAGSIFYAFYERPKASNLPGQCIVRSHTFMRTLDGTDFGDQRLIQTDGLDTFFLTLPDWAGASSSPLPLAVSREDIEAIDKPCRAVTKPSARNLLPGDFSHDSNWEAVGMLNHAVKLAKGSAPLPFIIECHGCIADARTVLAGLPLDEVSGVGFDGGCAHTKTGCFMLTFYLDFETRLEVEIDDEQSLTAIYIRESIFVT